MANTSEVDQGLPTAELRRDVLNRDRPAPDVDAHDAGCLVDPVAPDATCDCGAVDRDAARADDDGMVQPFADSDDFGGVLARHPFDLGGEA